MTQPSHNVAFFLDEQVRAHPDAEALCLPEGREAQGRTRYRCVRYAALGKNVRSAAALLRARGVRKGTRVLIMVRPGEALIVLVYALFWLGAVPVVIDPGMGLKPFLKAVRRTQPDALVGVPVACLLARVFRKTFAPARIRIQVGKSFIKRLESKPTPCAPDAPETPEPCAPDDPAAILFTSGSTGAPKGVCYTHGMFAEQVRLLREVFGFGPGERDFPMLPVFSLFNPSLGLTTIVPQINPSRPAQADPAKLVAALVEQQATMSFGSPVLWAKVCAYCLKHGVVLAGLRRILSAGAPVPPRVLRQLAQVAPHAVVQTPYGATEALPVAVISGEEVLVHTWARTQAGQGTCVGKTVGDIAVAVIPIEDRVIARLSDTRTLPAGEIGEICVSGTVVTHTYDRLPEATARAKLQGPRGECWHRMGDAGYLDAQGRLWFCGRVVERVALAQGTLFTDPCEAVFNQDDAVFRTALMGLDLPDGKEPALAVEPLPGHWPATRAQKTAFARRLWQLGQAHAHTRNIRRFYFVKHFPVDVRHNAKIHRLHLARACAAELGKTVALDTQGNP